MDLFQLLDPVYSRVSLTLLERIYIFMLLFVQSHSNHSNFIDFNKMSTIPKSSSTSNVISCSSFTYLLTIPSLNQNGASFNGAPL